MHGQEEITNNYLNRRTGVTGEFIFYITLIFCIHAIFKEMGNYMVVLRVNIACKLLNY